MLNPKPGTRSKTITLDAAVRDYAQHVDDDKRRDLLLRNAASVAGLAIVLRTMSRRDYIDLTDSSRIGDKPSDHLCWYRALLLAGLDDVTGCAESYADKPGDVVDELIQDGLEDVVVSLIIRHQSLTTEEQAAFFI